MFENIEGMNVYLLIPIVLVIIVIIYLFQSRKKQTSPQEPMDMDEVYEVIQAAGYVYGGEQDIFYSHLEAWQRDMGYCRLYDETAAPLSMIMDCEPIYFEYGGKRWMIEFWKGQYGMTAGCEIGVYNTDGPDLNIPGAFNGTFYYCASDEELLRMQFVLKKGDQILFTREDRHWWLTGFKLGEFAEPSELIMSLKVTLKDRQMRDAFVEGLKKAGYEDEEIAIEENIVSLVYDTPKTPQPYTRIPGTDWITQRKNERLCEMYQEITKEYDDFPDKILAIQQQAPDLFDKVLDLGKSSKVFEKFDIIKRYLDE